MKLEPLFNLKIQLENTLLAGTKLIGENFRLRKALEDFEPLSEVNPVFAKIKASCSKIFSSENVNEDILSALMLVKAVCYTQGDCGAEYTSFAELETKERKYENIPSEFLRLLQNPHASEGEIIVSSFKNHPEYLNDMRGLKGFVKALKHFMTYGSTEYAKPMKAMLDDFLENSPDRAELEKLEEVMNVTGDFDIKDGCICQYYGHDDEIIIPDGITHISASVFRNTEIKSVRFPEGFESIGIYAFCGCHNLRKVEFPESISNIGNYAFQDCINLEEIKVPKDTKAGYFTFKNCRINECDFKNYFIKNGLAIKDSSILYFANPSFKFPKDIAIKKICEKAFSECDALKTFEIPDFVTELEPRIFFRCKHLKEVKISAEIKELSEFIFEGCTSLKKVKLPSCIEKVSAGAFFDCCELKEVEGFENVKSVESDSFSSCSHLKSLKLHPSVTFKGRSFYNCIRLDSKTVAALKKAGAEDFS